MTYSVEERLGWSYVVGNPQPRDHGPWRYRWEAQEYANELNAKIESDAKVIADLRAAFLVVLKAENKCWSFENGKPCDTAHCGCLLEMQCYIDDAAFKRRVDEQTAGENDGSARR